MTCRHTRALLSDHRESLLPGHAAQKLTAHLAECADCRRVREEMTAAGAALRDLAAPLPSRDLRSQALTAWTLEEGRGSRQRDVGGGEAPVSWRLALGLVVVVSLVLSWSQLSQRERLLPGSAGTSPGQGLNPLSTRTNPAEAGSRTGRCPVAVRVSSAGSAFGGELPPGAVARRAAGHPGGGSPMGLSSDGCGASLLVAQKLRPCSSCLGCLFLGCTSPVTLPAHSLLQVTCRATPQRQAAVEMLPLRQAGENQPA
jgi:hypothetical protein